MTKRNVGLAVHVSLLAFGEVGIVVSVIENPGRPCLHPPVVRFINKYVLSNTFIIVAWTLLWLKFTGNVHLLSNKANALLKYFVVDTGLVVQRALIVDILLIICIKR